MTQISILEGVYIDDTANLRASYPVNLEPVVVDTGLSGGFLRTAPGLTIIGDTGLADRGAIWWNGFVWRVMFNKVIKIDGNTITTFGDVSFGTDPISLDYSFDLLAIVTQGDLFYCDGATVNQVDDPDLGYVIDVQWVDGYFVLTDGEFILVTDLNDPYSVNPLKYGSSEEDPDPVLALKKVRGELYVLNRYTIENFQNVGGDGFPFARIASNLIPYGCVGTHANCDFLETFAFVGSARNEALSVFLAGTGSAARISTPEIDRKLADLTDAQAALIEVEAVSRQGEQQLYIHLPTVTMVYSHQASLAAKKPVWHYLADGPELSGPYRARHFALAQGRFVGGNSAGRIGYIDEAQISVFGDTIGWQFDTTFIYNEGRGGILKSLEAVGQPGHVPGGGFDPVINFTMTPNGVTWTAPMTINLGRQAQYDKRIQFRPKRRFKNRCGLRFGGFNTGLQSFSRLEIEVEPLDG